MKGKNVVPSPPVGGDRVVKFVEEHFRTLPASVPEFDRYTPSTYLTEHRSAVLKKVDEAELEAALGR